MLPRKTIRLGLIALTTIASFLVLIRSFFTASSEPKIYLSNFVFPQTVPLKNWTQINTVKLDATDQKAGDIGKIYKYSREGKNLTIQIRYQRYTDSNISRLLMNYINIPPATLSPTIKHIQGVGYYAVFKHEDTANLTACLNPQGETTVTEQQFTTNRYASTLGFQRTLLWIIGQRDLTDGRCLWTLISMPISVNPEELIFSLNEDEKLSKDYQTLKTVWLDWHQWWLAHFPPEL